MDTSYLLPAATTTWENTLEIKRSRFLSFARRVQSEDAARAFIAELKSTYPDARHHCSAFIVHLDDAVPVERSSDDGEPSGTAGKPMLDVVKGSGLADVAVVVVRYFGGIKLGAGGLVHAYSEATSAVLDKVRVVRRDLRELYTIDVLHADAGRVEADLRTLIARGLDASLADTAYGSTHATLTAAIAPGSRAALEEALSALTAGEVSINEAEGEGRTEWVELQ